MIGGQALSIGPVPFIVYFDVYGSGQTSTFFCPASHAEYDIEGLKAYGNLIIILVTHELIAR